MTESGYYVLRYENSITYGAVATFGKTCFGTVGSFSRVYNRLVTESGYYVLCYKSSITYRTVTACGKTCFGTCGSYSVIYSRGMTESSELGVNTAKLSVAYGTVSNHIIATLFSTGGIYVIFLYGSACGVTESRENLFLGLITMLTYICCQTVIYTGRSNYGNIP